MTITKFGHCCLLLDVKGKRILVDPGRFSTAQNTLKDIAIILITHEHADHCHSESLAEILKHNPDAVVVTNKSVSALLQSLQINVRILEEREHAIISDIQLEAYDGEHVEIYGDFGLVQNTGYLVDSSFFFPGDAYTVPDKKVDLLALPVAGPWCKISDAISYAKHVGARVAVPVHDATLSEVGKAVTYPHFERELAKSGTSFVIPEIDIETEL